MVKKRDKCIRHGFGDCGLCNREIPSFKAEDFKINIDGKNVKVTKATFNPFTGGYFLEWNEDIESTKCLTCGDETCLDAECLQ